MMHVISTNWHVPYLALLAKIPDVTWWVLSFRNGMAARETVLRQFTLQTFLGAWGRLLAAARPAAPVAAPDAIPMPA